MKSFEEYINEARQNYIFGGTDDRNTDVDAKTFAELKPGDLFYWFHIHYDDLDRWGASCLEFVSIQRKDSSNIDLVFKEGSVKLRTSVLNNSLYVFGIGTMAVYIASTDYAMFVEAVEKETSIHLSEKDITVGKLDRHK